jgi:hypothetical protein
MGVLMTAVTGRLSMLATGCVLALALGSTARAALNSAQQKCIDGYNTKLRLVSQQAGKSARACIKKAGKNLEPNPDTCIVNNTDNKIAGKEAKVADLVSRRLVRGTNKVLCVALLTALTYDLLRWISLSNTAS